MSEAIQSVPGARSGLVPRIRNWLGRAWNNARRYRPEFSNRHFWIVQGLIFLIAIAHDIIEAGGYLPHLGMLYFLPISIFFVPVVYAALNFGFPGAIATASWATLLTVPNWIFWHSGSERWGVIYQLLLLNTVAFFVGHRVDREIHARTHAESASTALAVSEKNYRSLFEESPAPILILNIRGAHPIVLEANPAAGALLDKADDSLRGMPLAELVGLKAAGQLAEFSANPESPLDVISLAGAPGLKQHFKPILFQAGSSPDNADFHLVLRDITDEHNRQAGIRAYAASVIQSQEEERKRIARELHDDIIQALVVLHRSLNSADSGCENQPGSSAPELSEAKRNVEEVVGRLRTFATNLRPPALDDLGVVASIRRLLADLSAQYQLKTELIIDGEPRRLPPDLELTLFRIAQEALRNVERHARATEAAVTIRFRHDEVTLEVRDDGVGFIPPRSPTDLVASAQLGLIGMRERAELLGGNLRVESAPGKGTTVVASLSVSGAASKP